MALTSIDFVIPRHNDKPAVRARQIAKLATFSVEEIEAAIRGYEASIERNDGVEFDDVRARHWASCAVKDLKEALANKLITDHERISHNV